MKRNKEGRNSVLISVCQMQENMYHTYVNMPYTPINMQKKNKFKRGTEGLTGLSAPLKTPQSEGLQGVLLLIGQQLRGWNIHPLLVELQTGITTLEINLEAPQKIGNRFT